MGLGINVIPLVGLGAIRLATVGGDDGPADARELEAMRAAVRQCLGEGCFGASSGLVYAPSSFADQDELVALARVVAEAGGIYATHMRDEGPSLLESVDSAIEVGRRAGVSVQISHLKALGRKNWGTVAPALERIDAAIADGVDIWFDVYPYTACSSTLGSLLPATAFADGAAGFERACADPARRRELVRHLESGDAIALAGVTLADVPGSPELTGARLSEAADRMGIAASELCLDLLVAHGTEIVMVAEAMAEEDVVMALRHDRAIAGSDGWTLSVDSVGYAHPRNFGSAIRLLQTYVREREVLTLDEAIELLSGRPARRLGLSDRGHLGVGAVADVVVLDLEGMDAVSSFADPCRYPQGVTDVIVGGVLAVAGGRLTGQRNGRVLAPTNGASPA